VFDDTDRPDTEKVAIINQRLADTYWPDGDPIGASIEEEDGAHTIVGVVADNKHGSLAEIVERMRYRVAAQAPDVLTSMVVRTDVPPNTLAAAVRDAVRATAASATISDVASLAVRVDRTTAMPRFRSAMLTGLALIAMILAMLGLYGVVALSVAERRREIGVRMTLGAERRDILRQVLGGGARLIVAGIALGLVTAAAGVRLIESYVFEVPTTDPVTFAGVARAVLGIGVLATWVPARRASGIEPLIVLRSD
jgi:cell division protein FtsX